ncbi:MFS transporter [Nisaea sediminum]|uniref:MFS transporter n=1 Tax=Nisaea sediminum TaxID=2775867 RepID=UPI0018684A6A|nr:MFS transporter [Nisaea sediminum]
MTAETAALPFSRLKLLAYGFPGLPLAALGVPLFIFLPSFYAQDRGLSLAAVGLVLLAARLWDAVTDPVIGLLSDRIATRFGRRKPWLLAGTPLTCLAVYMLFVPPEGAGALHLFAWSAALYLGWTMVQLPYTTWGAELSGDYHERSRITAFRETMVVFGTLLASAMPAAIAAAGGENSLDEVLTALAIFLILALPLSVMLAAGLVAETPRPTPVRKMGDRWRAGAALLVRNKPFLRLILAYLLNGLANGLAATLFVLFVQKGLALPDAVDTLLLTYFLLGIAGVPLWLFVSHRLGKHRTWILAMLLNSAIFATVPLLGPGDYFGFLAICIGTGLCLGADLVLPPSMQADVVDVDTAEGGGARTGLYFALWGMATKLALALAVGIAFPVLELAGFDATGANDAGALLTLSLLYGAAPVVLKLAAIAIMRGFPVTAEKQAELRRKIDLKFAETRPGS